MLTLAPAGGGLNFLRNLGNLYFTSKNATSGLPVSISGARQIAVADWNNDDLLDILVARDGQPPALFLRRRGGLLILTNSPANWAMGNVIAVGDLDNDQRADLVIAGGTQMIIAFGDGTNSLSLALNGFEVNRLLLVDYDNDGWLDLLAAGNSGLRVWRNVGPKGFSDVTAFLSDWIGSPGAR